MLNYKCQITIRKIRIIKLWLKIMRTEYMRPELITPCGMNCRICIAFFGYTMSGNKRKMKCIGCKQSGKSCAHLKKYCKKLTKKEIEYCYQCNDFPCKQLQKLDSKYRERFNMSMIDNLEYIKENGMENFLKKQEEKYRCLKCNGVICVHKGICFNCDSDNFKKKHNL